MRRIPGLHVLEAWVRRPRVRQLGVGLTLLVPAALWLATAPQPDAGRLPSPTTEVREAVVDEVTRAWAARQMERERTETIATLAQAFNVDPTLGEKIHDAAVSERIDPEMAFGLVRAESSFRTKAVSPVGAVGLTQVMPSTARWLQPGTTRKDLMDPDVNLRLGFKYLRQLIDQYSGNEELALTAYNRGPGTVNRLLKRGRNPDNGYAEKVLTGTSEKHVRLMNQKFGRRRS